MQTPGDRDPAELTRLLQGLGGGEGDREDAAARLLELVYDELRSMAAARMANERRDHTLQATELVHEAYVRLTGGKDVAWDSRAHFFGAAARAMARVLIEHARARGRRKRGGGARRLPLDVVDLAVEADLDAVLAVQDAVDRLAEQDARMAEIVRLRFYAGLSVEDTASALDVSSRTVRREWAMARAWLIRELGGERDGDDGGDAGGDDAPPAGS